MPFVVVPTDPRKQLKRAHSADPDGIAKQDAAPSTSNATTLSPAAALNANSAASDSSSNNKIGDAPPEGLLGSPLKKARPSIDQTNAGDRFSAAQSLSAALDSTVSGAPSTSPQQGEAATPMKKTEEEEEL